jgi:hypothetical protein
VGELDDEGRLAEVFGRFGGVLAATLRREGSSSWALLTFGEAEAALSAVAGAAESLGVRGLVVRTLDMRQAMGEASRHLLSEAMRAHQQQVVVGVAVSCVGPIAEKVFSADVSVVDAAEYRRASTVLGELFMLDPLLVSAEFSRNERVTMTQTTMGNAYNAVFQKDPAELTREDALTVSVDCAVYTAGIAISMDATWNADEGLNGVVQLVATTLIMVQSSRPPSEAFLERLAMLLLDVIREPQGTPEFTLAGVVCAICWILSGRVALAVPLIEAGLLETVVATLQRSSPVEWVTLAMGRGVIKCRPPSARAQIYIRS